MNKFGKYIVVAAISLSLITGSASALTRKVKDTGSNKAKASDTVKQAVPTKPVAPSKVDSTTKSKVTPAKFNDFLDTNKNGIDDRVEKCNPEAKKGEPKKPAPTTATPAKKPAETKKSVSPGTIKVSPKKTK